jgi:CTP synthase (UTP-ammonia lyase)
MSDADHEESAPASPTLVITRLVCSLRGTDQEVHIFPGTLAFQAYRRERSVEKFMCSYGVNETYRANMFGDDLKVAGQDESGNVRIVERPSHPFFMATLFLPQLSSAPGSPHPLIVAFLQAAAAFGRRSRSSAG